MGCALSYPVETPWGSAATDSLVKWTGTREINRICPASN